MTSNHRHHCRSFFSIFCANSFGNYLMSQLLAHYLTNFTHRELCLSIISCIAVNLIVCVGAFINNLSIELYIIVINGRTIVIMNYLTIQFNVLNQIIGQKSIEYVRSFVARQNENKTFWNKSKNWTRITRVNINIPRGWDSSVYFLIYCRV